MRRKDIAISLLVMTLSLGWVISGNGADQEMKEPHQVFQTTQVHLSRFKDATEETFVFIDFEGD